MKPRARLLPLSAHCCWLVLLQSLPLLQLQLHQLLRLPAWHYQILFLLLVSQNPIRFRPPFAPSSQRPLQLVQPSRAVQDEPTWILLAKPVHVIFESQSSHSLSLFYCMCDSLSRALTCSLSLLSVLCSVSLTPSAPASELTRATSHMM